MTSRLPRERRYRRSPAGEKVMVRFELTTLQLRRLPLLIPLSYITPIAMVGVGIEPTTFGSSDRRYYHLSYPTRLDVRGRIRTYDFWFRRPALLVPLSYTDKPGSAGIPACLLRSVDLCRKPRRQGCLRSQEISQDGRIRTSVSLLQRQVGARCPTS